VTVDLHTAERWAREDEARRRAPGGARLEAAAVLAATALLAALTVVFYLKVLG
jgi:hypothetical protein